MRILALVLFVVAACGSGKLYNQVDVGGNERIYEGMSSDEITKVMGRPDNVSSGTSRKYETEFMMLGMKESQIEAGWIEWAWNRPGKIYVAYLSGGIVQKVGVVTPKQG